MLEFRFTMPDKSSDLPFHIGVEVYEHADILELIERSRTPFVNIPDPLKVGEIYLTSNGEQWEAWDAHRGDPSDPPVFYLDSAHDFPKHIMFEIPKEAWLGPS